MKKRVVIISILVIILILCAIFAIVKITTKTKSYDLVFELYNKMIQDRQYSFMMENSENNFKTTISQKDDKTMIDMISNDVHNATLIKDNATYFIMHDTQEYYYYDSDDVEAGILTDELYRLQGKEYTSGKEEINGIKYKYEEFSGFSAFITNTTRDMNEEEIKTRFYFDGNNDNLVYVKTITQNTEELLKIELSYEVEDSIFEIPSNYAEK